MRAGILMGLVSASYAALASGARAEDTRPVDEGEIVVTAQKRAQALTDVAINVSVVDAAAITERRIEAVTDIAAFTANASIKETAPGLVPVITIRGVGLDDFSATNNPSAGVYVDEVFLSSLALMNFDLFDVERMEVLKGPQGTLYGRNSTAGALNIVSARPSLGGSDGRVAASIGNYESGDLEAMVNVPLSDTLAVRASGKGVFQREGFYFNRLTDRDIGRRALLLGRLQLRWQPIDRLDILLKAEGQRGRSELGQGAFFGVGPTPPTTTGVTCPGRPQCADFFGYRDVDGDPFAGDWSVDPDYDLNQINLTGRIEADLGFAKLTSITAYIGFDRKWGVDTDAGPRRLSEFRTNDVVRQASQELRLAGSTPLVDWLVGGFYSWDRVKTRYDGSLQDLFNTTTRTTSDQRTWSAAVFANGEWRLTDTVRLVTGLRYTSEIRRNRGATLDLVSQPPASFVTLAPFGTPPIPLASVNARISDQNWSYKLGLNWKPTPRTLVYASVSQGVKSGGFFAGVATNSAQLRPYLPERLVAYELGAKARVPALGLTATASGFYYDYNNVQTFIRDTSGNLPIQRLGNVRKAEIYGFDGDVTIAPAALPGLSVGTGIGLLRTRLGAFTSSGGPVPAGNRLPDAPKFSLNVNAAYQTAIGGGLAARFAIDGRHQSFTFKDALNDPVIAAAGFWVWNGRVTLMREGDWDVSAWAKNLANERYVVQGVNQLVLGFGYRVYGAPRTFGLSAAKRF